MKLKYIGLILVIIISLTACNSKEVQEEKVENAPSEEIEDSTSANKDEQVIKEVEVEKVESQFDFTNMKTKDIEGNKIEGDIFSGKTTLVNVWGTFCNPCLVEMPDLEKINQNLGSDDFQVIGIISDTYIESEENIDVAKEVINQTGITYTNLIPDGSIYENILIQTQVIPTSFLLDEEGNIIGDVVFGARDYKFLETWINKSIEKSR